ncbi:hypothetical protein M9H77_13826 [Catharanthus roseus]|uniref:Uncharacterized protein n=1 Tax=Catharanthus roseus TaxID=4058 RepID=A0ACC0BL98_CATRO|nr:hypothetical protein M9H77_13826 [Catharanthus roseus]
MCLALPESVEHIIWECPVIEPIWEELDILAKHGRSASFLVEGGMDMTMGKDWRLSIRGFDAYHQVCQKGFLSNPQYGKESSKNGEKIGPKRHKYATGRYYGNLGYQEYDEGDSCYKIGQSCWKKNEMMGRDFRVDYENYEGSSYSYMDDGYGHWYPYEQEATQKETRNSRAQKKVRLEEHLKEIGVMSNEHIGKKTSIGEPSYPWSKKSETEESARSQEVMLDKNDACEAKESHERIGRVEKKVERDESEISEERKEGTMQEKESLFEEDERINEEEESEKEENWMEASSNHKETSISFSSNSLPLSIEISFKELKLFLNAHVFHEDVFGKLFKDSLSNRPSYLIVCILKSSQSYTFLEYPLMLGDATRDHSCDNSLYDSRMNHYYSYVANVDSFVLGVENKEELKLGVLENKGKSLEKELLNLKEETTMSFSLNPSPLYYEFSFKELNLLLESPSFHGGIFLESLVESCSAKRVSWFNCSLCDDLHDKYVEKFVEDCSDMSSFLDTFVRHHEAFTLVNQLLLHVNEHFEFPCNRHEFFMDDESLKTLLNINNCGFQFFHLYFKKFIVVLESENNWGEFLEKAVFEEVCRKFCDLENFVNTFPHLKCEVVKSLKHEEYSSLPLEFFWKMCFSFSLPFRRRVCPNFKNNSSTPRI